MGTRSLLKDHEVAATWRVDSGLMMTTVPVGNSCRLDCEMYVYRRLDGRLIGEFSAKLRRQDGLREKTINLGSRPVSMPGPLVWPSEEARQLLHQHFGDQVSEKAESLPSPQEVDRLTTDSRLDSSDRRVSFSWQK